ncbi:MAG TPA: hypothetical protein VFI54_16280 [Solirubrobacteraceae bacterium]|nr:hypothetical protein [Solirubrobacteraceae bacterium]
MTDRILSPPQPHKKSIAEYPRARSSFATVDLPLPGTPVMYTSTIRAY